jgi:hypothetical protein
MSQDVLSPDSTAFAHALENSSLIVEIDRRVKLSNLSSIHDANTVVVDDGFQSMCNAEKRLSSETVLHTGLNLRREPSAHVAKNRSHGSTYQSIRLKIHTACGFIAYNDLRAANKGTSQR